MKRSLAGFASLALLFLPSCHPAPENPVPIPARMSMAKPSFSRNIQPLFDQYCSAPGCHADLPGAGNLNLTQDFSYIQLVNVTALLPVTCVSNGVTTIADVRVSELLSDPYKSVLMHRLEATCNPLPQMPSAMPPLDKGQLDIIRNWILNGAPHN